MKQKQNYKIEAAQVSDAEALAKLIDIAGEGIPSWLWRRSAASGQEPLAIGVERAQRESGGFSYRNAIVARAGARVAGMMLGYPISKAPEDDPDDLPAPIAPFVELEAKSVGTWYVNALAVFPEFQGQGIGSRLLRAAEASTIKANHTATSIQVYGQNFGARRLYERNGFNIIDQAAVRDHPCQPYYTGDVLLLAREHAR